MFLRTLSFRGNYEEVDGIDKERNRGEAQGAKKTIVFLRTLVGFRGNYKEVAGIDEERNHGEVQGAEMTSLLPRTQSFTGNII